MLFIGIPDVFELIKDPFFLYLSSFSKTSFFISIFSITTSIIQSAVSTFSISSSKFPISILSINFLLYKGDGFDLIVLFSDEETILFLNILSFSFYSFFNFFIT